MIKSNSLSYLAQIVKPGPEHHAMIQVQMFSLYPTADEQLVC